MSRFRHCLLSILVLPLVLGYGQPALADGEPADTVLRNGQVYTVNDRLPWAQAVAVRDGVIVAVGDDEAVAPYLGPTTRVLDLDGKFVMPGLHDAHLHMQLVVDLQENLRLDAYQPWDRIEEAIAEYAWAHPDRAWIYGASLPWLSDVIGDFSDVPAHKSVLDRIVPDRPVAIRDIGGHAMLVNSQALEVAGIHADTPNPTGGMIERDANGQATGVLRELAIHVVTESMDGLSVEQYEAGLPQAVAQLNAVGITSVHEVWTHTTALQALKRLDEANRLSLRVTAAITHPADFVTPPAKDAARQTIHKRERYRGKRLKPDYVKFILDGAVNRTAAMLEPYQGTDFRGHTRDPIDVVMAEVSRLHGLGLGSVLHAVGDRAVRIALDAVERAIASHGQNGVRHAIAHTVFVNPADRDRFAELGVIAEFSPYFWWPNAVIDSYRAEVGEQRLAWVWAIKDMVDRGVSVAAGSDWPVVYSPNPFPAIEAMVTRREPGGGSVSFRPEQAITLEQALKIFTLGGAFALYQEDVTGSIEVGKYADLVVLDRHLFSIPITEVGTVRVLQTWLEGELVFDRTSGAG